MGINFKIDRLVWHGCRYVTLEPIFNEWIDGIQWTKIDWWCRETYGPAGDAWSINAERYYINNAKFFFRDPKDADWFLLKWS